MSQTLVSKNNSNRRSVLTFAIAAALVPLSGTAFALDNHESAKVSKVISGAEKTTRTSKTIETAASLRELWLGHIFWVRNVSIAAIDKNDLAVKAAEQQAERGTSVQQARS